VSAQDKAGLVSTTLSDSIVLKTAPTIEFTSPSPQISNTQDYTLTYTVDGVPTTETWKLGNGENRLMVHAGSSGAETFKTYTVTWNAPLVSDPAPFDSSNESLVSMTTEDGLILKYRDGNLVSIEKPNEYTFHSLSLILIKT